MREPSVLDYIKSRLMPWKYPKIALADEFALASKEPTKDENSAQVTIQEEQVETAFAEQPGGAIRARSPLLSQAKQVPWKAIAALILAIAGQASLAPRVERHWLGGVFLLVTAISLFLLAVRRQEWIVPEAARQTSQEEFDPPRINLTYILIGLLLGGLTFLSLGQLQFSIFSLCTWGAALYFSGRAFWASRKRAEQHHSLLDFWNAIRKGTGQFTVHLHKKTILYLFVIAWVLFFRLFLLERVPPEMNSDHAEKLLDSMRVFAGQFNIFFPNNGGREPLQMYLVAAIHRYLNVDWGFMVLKLVSVSIGLLTLPFLYLMGKEWTNARVGWLAVAFAGIAYWPNVVARFGLRLPFYMLFTAATMYYLLRGLRRGSRNDFIYAGISLGLSFYGYSADRVLPLVVILAVGLFMIHTRDKTKHLPVLTSTLALIFVSLILFLPLGRYILEEPQGFFFRTLTRMGNLERPLPGPAWEIFIKNMGNALAMFSWSGGNIWPISIPGYPALDMVCGGLFYLGLSLTLVRYVQRRHWYDAFLVLSLPVLLLPSVLSLAFPAENPNLYRTGGTMVIVFLFIGMALDGLWRAFTERLAAPWGTRAGFALLSGLFILSSLQNYDWVFRRYHDQYLQSAWNSSEMGMVIRSFSLSFGHPDNAWVVGYPHWVDTRLVGINAGVPHKDYQIFPDQFEQTLEIKAAKLFLLNPSDLTAIEKLRELYPQGWFQVFDSKVETKDFLMFIVPPQQGFNPIPEDNSPEANASPH